MCATTLAAASGTPHSNVIYLAERFPARFGPSRPLSPEQAAAAARLAELISDYVYTRRNDKRQKTTQIPGITHSNSPFSRNNKGERYV
ncbi:hypothetical protein ABWL39_20430 [Chitinivorax sp. PXF-14]|uniref:hypothetical protein n=1 Tax=Chitinivorax sp. PXF-14 TaxID=3230488 RepID=UPI00346529ED